MTLFSRLEMVQHSFLGQFLLLLVSLSICVEGARIEYQSAVLTLNPIGYWQLEESESNETVSPFNAVEPYAVRK